MDPEKQRQHDGDGDGDGAAAAEADIERLPVDLLAHILSLLSSFRDLSMYVRTTAAALRPLPTSSSCYFRCSDSLCSVVLLLCRRRQGWGSEPEVALCRGAGAGVAAAAELRGPAHRQRHRRAPHPRRRQPPRPRHVSSPDPQSPISLSPRRPADRKEAPLLKILILSS